MSGLFREDEIAFVREALDEAMQICSDRMDDDRKMVETSSVPHISYGVFEHSRNKAIEMSLFRDSLIRKMESAQAAPTTLRNAVFEEPDQSLNTTAEAKRRKAVAEALKAEKELADLLEPKQREIDRLRERIRLVEDDLENLENVVFDLVNTATGEPAMAAEDDEPITAEDLKFGLEEAGKLFSAFGQVFRKKLFRPDGSQVNVWSEINRRR